MARPSLKLIQAIINAGKKINNSNQYEWGHMGKCNCGYLAQELTTRSAREIHQMAIQRTGDWNDQCVDYCPESKIPFDEIISELLSNGLALEDLMALENLSDTNVLSALPERKRYLNKNDRDDVVLYFQTWGNYLESKLEQNVAEITNCIPHKINEELIKKEEIYEMSID